MKRSKSYHPGMTGSSGNGLCMLGLNDTLPDQFDEQTSYFDYEEPIMEDLESDSNMSISSSEEQVFSYTYHSPTHFPPSQEPFSRGSMSSNEDLIFEMELYSRPHSPNHVQELGDVNQISPSSQSRAIAIPSTRRSEPNSVPALSARGDLQGAYFPRHEDPNRRITPTHPFQSHAVMARRNSIKQAAASARAKIPTTAEIGLDGKPKIPTGKYYPANWEKAHNQPPLPIPAELQSLVQPSITVPYNPTSPKKFNPVSFNKPLSPSPGTQIPTNGNHRHNRTESEAQRLVHAYQREMVIQASMGIVSVAEGSTYRGDSSPAAGPISPRLEPLGSPIGPVTPMSLEDENGGYLTLGQPMTPEAASFHSAEVNRAIRADRARRQEQGHKHNNSSHSHPHHQHQWSALSAGLSF
ncbi:hypothetical protein QBC43DRAFT_96227 [Cladorrhinum sp. PSN259]|nr:hypothetical protein QBC43DRAFT_96227 [Cladorrhinum sp. PSN259]